MAWSRGIRAVWSTSMTEFLTAQAFNISLNVVHPPVSDNQLMFTSLKFLWKLYYYIRYKITLFLL